jgi:hypothetical protein
MIGELDWMQEEEQQQQPVYGDNVQDSSESASGMSSTAETAQQERHAPPPECKLVPAVLVEVSLSLAMAKGARLISTLAAAPNRSGRSARLPGWERGGGVHRTPSDESNEVHLSAKAPYRFVPLQQVQKLPASGADQGITLFLPRSIVHHKSVVRSGA